MKQIMFGAFLLFTWISSYAQDKIIPLEGEKTRKSLVTDYVDLGESGLLIRECIATAPAPHRGYLSYYSSDGHLHWRQEIRTMMDRDHHIVSSPDGSFVYAISFGSKTSFLQIRKDGSNSKYEPEQWKSFAAGLQTILADNIYLYFINSYSGNEYSKTKKGTEKLVLQRLRHSDFSRDAQLLDLPPVQSDDNVTFWSFLGQTSSAMYLHSKTIDTKSGIIKFTIVPFYADFAIGTPVTAEHKLDQGQTLVNVGTHLGKRNRGIGVVKDMDFEYIPASQTSGRSTVGGQANVTLDPKAGELYLYYFAKTGKANHGPAEGHLVKYDQTGGLIWNTSFKTDLPHTAKIEFLAGTINLSSFADASVNIQEIASDGKAIGQFKIPYQPKAIFTHEQQWRLARGLVDGKPSKSLAQILKFTKADFESNLFMNFFSEKNELMIVAPKKGPAQIYVYDN